MGNKISGQGWFAVKIEMRGTRPVAVLTGDHFRPDEREVANAFAGVYGNESVCNGGSPVYLVKDSVVDVALRASDMKLSSTLIRCHDGLNGNPCGKCEKCRAAREKMFTRVILGAIELPDNNLSAKLVDAIRNVIGLSWADAPWEDPMTEDEVNEVFEELGVTPVKEGE